MRLCVVYFLFHMQIAFRIQITRWKHIGRNKNDDEKPGKTRFEYRRTRENGKFISMRYFALSLSPQMLILYQQANTQFRNDPSRINPRGKINFVACELRFIPVRISIVIWFYYIGIIHDELELTMINMQQNAYHQIMVKQRRRRRWRREIAIMIGIMTEKHIEKFIGAVYKWCWGEKNVVNLRNRIPWRFYWRFASDDDGTRMRMLIKHRYYALHHSISFTFATNNKINTEKTALSHMWEHINTLQTTGLGRTWIVFGIGAIDC